AESAREANRIAEDLGCYWDGCDSGIDCNCCGYRWSSKWSDDMYVNLEKYQENGYEVGVYDHYTDPENEWKKKYGRYKLLQEPKWTEKFSRKYEGKIYFDNIEEYAQFLANEYGWTSPDARIFYKDGRIVEIFKDKK